MTAYVLRSDGSAPSTSVTSLPALRHAAPLPAAPAPDIVFAADRAPAANGEIFRVTLDGRLVDLSRSPAQDVAPAVSPDGKRVAFLSDRGGHIALYVVGIQGHGLRRLSRSLAVSRFEPSDRWGQVAWSPDGRKIVAGSLESGFVYLTGLDGHGRILERRPKSIYKLTWSPDGRLFAYDAGFGITVRNASGAVVFRKPFFGQALGWTRSDHLLAWPKPHIRRDYDADGRLVGVHRGDDVNLPRGRPLVSPDGSLVASWASAEELPGPQTTPWRLNVSERGHRRARTLLRSAPCQTLDGAPMTRLQFTPNGRSLVYQTACDSPVARLYGMSADGSHVRALQVLPWQMMTSPVFSPNGRFIAFVPRDEVSCDKGCQSHIWVMDADGRHAKPVSFPDEYGYGEDTSPSWSRDGRQILYSGGEFAGTLFKVARAGGKRRPLNLHGEFPAWGPTRIAFVGGRDGGVWTADSRGGHLREIDDRQGARSPAWSRQGRLAYIASTKRNASIIEVVGKPRAVPLPFVATGLAWSPDGKRLLVSGNELWVVDVASSRVRRLTTGMGNIFGASWR